jgi:hypothetical protein
MREANLPDDKPNPGPIVLEIAALPREQAGPFMILGLDKDAATPEIEAHWAQRLIWARVKSIRTPLEDVNWAKEVLLDRARRVAADVVSLNPDTSAGELRQILAKNGPLEPEVPTWEPRETPLPDLPEPPPNLLPNCDELRAGLAVPEVPLDLPAVARLLDEARSARLDPWDL